MKSLRYRFQAIAAASLLGICMFWSLPVRAQTAASGSEDAAVTHEATIDVTADSAKAFTAQNASLDVADLKLLLKPLTLEQLSHEAAAWLSLVQAKVQAVSDAELAVKQQNRAITAQERAVNSVETAQAKLVEAEAAQADATPNTPEYEAAAQKVEVAKAALKDAEALITEAEEAETEVEDNTALSQALAEAEQEQDVVEAEKVLNAAQKARQQLSADSSEYKAATDKIDNLDQSLRNLEKAKEARAALPPDSAEITAAENEVNQARDRVREAAQTITTEMPELVGEDLAPVESTSFISPSATASDSAEVLSAVESELKETSTVIEDTSEQLSADNLNTSAIHQAEQQLEGATATLEATAQEATDLKNQLVANATELQSEKTAIVDRFKVVLDEIDAKGGDTSAYRQYIQAVSGIEIDVTDTEGLGVRLVNWFQSEEGGLRWASNLATFATIVILVTILTQILGILLNRSLLRFSNSSSLLREFLVATVKRGGFVAGVLIALTALEVSLTPILAVVGGASFVLAFALQSNLGNFASGLMIMVNKPFDVGDEVKIGEIWGWVKSINLAQTRITGFTNEIITLPNNTVWSSNIVNLSGNEFRSVAIPFQISYDTPIQKVKETLDDICKANPLVSEKPAPSLSASKFMESGIKLCAYAYVKDQAKFWTMKTQLFAQIQTRFQEEGISLIDVRAVSLYDPSLSQDEDPQTDISSHHNDIDQAKTMELV